MNQAWSMDFMSDSLIDRRSIRTFHPCPESGIIPIPRVEPGLVSRQLILTTHMRPINRRAKRDCLCNGLA